jgi:FixJ family two-component response regulator
VGKALIYVVDDDATACESLSALLDAYGYDCAAYASASQLLSAIAARTPDCIVSDVQMPGMTGLDLLAALKPAHPDVPVIIMTGFADVPMAVTAMKQGAFDFLEKPIHGDALLGVVRTLLAAPGCRRPSAGARAAQALDAARAGYSGAAGDWRGQQGHRYQTGHFPADC